MSTLQDAEQLAYKLMVIDITNNKINIGRRW